MMKEMIFLCSNFFNHQNDNEDYTFESKFGWKKNEILSRIKNHFVNGVKNLYKVWL